MSTDVFGSQAHTIQTQNTKAPWGPQQPYLQQIFGQAQNLAAGPSTVPLSPYTQQAWQGIAARAAAGSPVTSGMQQNLTDTLQGKYLNPNTNPFFSQAVNDALGQAKSQFTGMYGGGAGGNVNNSGFQEGLTRTLGTLANTAYSQNYQNERQNQLSAAALAPSAAAQDYLNLQQLANVGGAQQAFGQYQIQAPWQQLANYQSLVGGNYGSQGTATQPYFTNPLANALGLGLGGTKLYQMLKGGGTTTQDLGQGVSGAFTSGDAAAASGLADVGSADYAGMLAAGTIAV